MAGFGLFNWKYVSQKCKKKGQNTFVRCGVRTHALLREPELKSGALDHSANLTAIEIE